MEFDRTQNTPRHRFCAGRANQSDSCDVDPTTTHTFLRHDALSILNPFVFVLPAASGEKVSLAVSILLSYTVFLSSASTTLPSNGDKECHFTMYLGFMVVISCLTVVLACIGAACFHGCHPATIQTHDISKVRRLEPAPPCMLTSEKDKSCVLGPERCYDTSSTEIKHTHSLLNFNWSRSSVVAGRIAFVIFFFLSIGGNVTYFQYATNFLWHTDKEYKLTDIE